MNTTSVRDRNIAVEIIKRSDEETMTVCEDLAEIYNLSKSWVYKIAKRQGAIKKKKELNGIYERSIIEEKEIKDMIRFSENFGIEVGKKYKIIANQEKYKKPINKNLISECVYIGKENRYFKFKDVTINRGSLINGKIKVKAV